MEGTEKREAIALYEVPLLPEVEVRSLIIKALPQAQLSAQNILLSKKKGKYQAFLMVPSSKVQEICQRKTVIINKESVGIKKPFTEAQVFIGSIPDKLSVEQIRTFMEAEFGKIVKIQEGQPHEESKAKIRHCYIQFQRDEDAEKCLFAPRKITINDAEVRLSRAYAINESDQTDKKLFLKINSPVEDIEDLERSLNEQFRKEGKLREKIRVENSKATITYTSAFICDRVLQNFKTGKIGKYDVTLRPYANKDSYTVFLGGLKPVSPEELERAFRHYEHIIACNVLKTNSLKINGTITFSSKDSYNRLLVEYKDDEAIKDLFEKKPYITQHMSAKERNDYKEFSKANTRKQPGPVIPPVPISYPMFGVPGIPPMQPMRDFPFSMPPMNRPMNYGMPPPMPPM